MQLIKKNLKIIIVIISLILLETITFEGARFICATPSLLSSPLDNAIPFVPAFIYPYVLWYLAIFFIPLIMYFKKPINFYKYATSLVIVILVSTIIFIAFPSTVSRPTIEVTGVTSWLVNTIFLLDTPALCCLPSMHCALCFLMLFYTSDIETLSKVYRTLIGILCILIVASTLFIKQHVIYDAILSLVIVTIVCFSVSKFNAHTLIEKIINKHTSTSS